MFRGCSKLKEIKGINNFDMSKVIKKNEMFSGCSNQLENIIFSNSGNTIDKNNNNKINNDTKEKPFAIIFISSDQNIRYAAVCNESDDFKKVETKLFNEYPELKTKNITYLFDGGIIDRNATIKQNKIKDNSNILITYNTEL